MDFLVLQKLVIAALLGSLVGLEREQKYQLRGITDSFGGVRTFVLLSLLGALAVVLNAVVPYAFLVVSLGVLALIVSSYWMTARTFGGKGATSEMAAIVIYLVGMIAGMGNFVLTTAVSIGVFLLLHYKDSLHDWVKGLRNSELISTVQFAIIAFVVLPLLPNQTFGPYDFFNPYLVWLMVVMIAGISYVSYFLVKGMGEKWGIGLTGFLAGLVSSTALTLSFSEQSRNNPKVVDPYVFAVVIANMAMLCRLMIAVFIINPNLALSLIAPIFVTGFVGFLATLWLWFKQNPREIRKNLDKNVQQLPSPFRLGPALKFAGVFTAVLFVTQLMLDYFGDRGLYVTSLISGLVDMDAIMVSVANLAFRGLPEAAATMAIFLAVCSNTLVKSVIFLVLGSRKVALKLALVFGMMVLSGALTLIFV